ncbi:MAG: hypothetical protein ABIX12_02545 [Rubrivivax sp.]
MDRIVVLRLEATGCRAEAALNGVPLLRLAPPVGLPAAGTVTANAVALPVNEFTLQGLNELTLTVQPALPGAPDDAPLQSELAERAGTATLQLLLPRVGQRAHPAHARTLTQLDWAVAAGDAYDAPLVRSQRVELPIGFPRWRWLDAPVLPDSPALYAAGLRFLQELASALMRGDSEPFVQATRLRLEELAQAYQRPLADEVGRLRAALQAWHAAGALQPALPDAAALRWRRVAGGRLLEAVNVDGAPAWRFAGVDGAAPRAWPMRLAQIDGRFYALR